MFLSIRLECVRLRGIVLPEPSIQMVISFAGGKNTFTICSHLLKKEYEISVFILKMVDHDITSLDQDESFFVNHHPSDQYDLFSFWVEGPNPYSNTETSEYLLERRQLNLYFKNMVEFAMIGNSTISQKKDILEGKSHLRIFHVNQPTEALPKLWHCVFHLMQDSPDLFCVPKSFQAHLFEILERLFQTFQSWECPEMKRFIQWCINHVGNPFVDIISKHSDLKGVESQTCIQIIQTMVSLLLIQTPPPSFTSNLQPLSQWPLLFETVLENLLSHFFSSNKNEKELLVKYVRFVTCCKREIKTSSWQDMAFFSVICHPLWLGGDPLVWDALLFHNIVSTEVVEERLRDLSHGILPDAFRCSLEGKSVQDNDLWDYVILAGSAFVYISNQTTQYPNDIDLWIPKRFAHQLKNIIQRLFQALSHAFPEDRIVLIVTKRTFTFLSPLRCRIQVILSDFSNPPQIPASFDLDYVKGYYQGYDRGWILPECLYAWTTKQIHFPRRILSQKRLEKCTVYGFSINDTVQTTLTMSVKDSDVLNVLQEAQKVTWSPYRTIVAASSASEIKWLEQSTLGWFYPPKSMSNDSIVFVFGKVFPERKVYFHFGEYIKNESTPFGTPDCVEEKEMISLQVPPVFGMHGDYILWKQKVDQERPKGPRYQLCDMTTSPWIVNIQSRKPAPTSRFDPKSRFEYMYWDPIQFTFKGELIPPSTCEEDDKNWSKWKLLLSQRDVKLLSPCIDNLAKSINASFRDKEGTEVTWEPFIEHKNEIARLYTCKTTKWVSHVYGTEQEMIGEYPTQEHKQRKAEPHGRKRKQMTSGSKHSASLKEQLLQQLGEERFFAIVQGEISFALRADHGMRHQPFKICARASVIQLYANANHYRMCHHLRDGQEDRNSPLQLWYLVD